jgi:hypothetical protein
MVNFTFNASIATISANNYRSVSVYAENVEVDELIDDIGMEEVLRVIDKEKIMDFIGKDEFMEHFGVVESNE